MLRLNIIKMAYRPNYSTDSKPKLAFLAEIDKPILEFIGAQVAKIVMKEIAKLGALTLPDFKAYYKAVVIKTMFY